MIGNMNTSGKVIPERKAPLKSQEGNHTTVSKQTRYLLFREAQCFPFFYPRTSAYRKQPCSRLIGTQPQGIFMQEDLRFTPCREESRQMDEHMKMNGLARQVEYWDRVAGDKAFSHPVDDDLMGQHLSAGSRILDYGCGYGRICDHLRQKGFLHVTGVDISSQMIVRGRQAYPGLDLRVMDALPLPFARGSFDAVLLFTVLTSIVTDEGQREIIKEILRLLRPHGILYVSDYPLQTDERNRERYRRFAGKYGCFGIFELPEGAVMRHLDQAWIAEIFSGFEQLAYREFPVMTMNNNPARAFQYLGKRGRAA